MSNLTTAGAEEKNAPATQPAEPDEKSLFAAAFNRDEPKPISESLPKPEPAKDTEEAEKPDDTAAKQSEDDKKESAEELAEEKPEEKPKENPPHKKTARERVQESRREMRKWQNIAEENQRKLEAMAAELEAIKAKKPEELTVKDQIREAVIEEKMSEAQQNQTAELHGYIDSLGEFIVQEKFKVDYDDHVPVLMEKDPWTVKTIGSLPEKFEVLRQIFDAISAKQFTLNDWVNEAKSVKLDAINRVLQSIRNPKQQEEPKKELPKKLPDSVIPDNSKIDNQLPEVSQEAVFRKAFRRD